MFQIGRSIYKTLNLIEISRKALLNNFNYFQSLQPDCKICPVLKSNAYGHGLELIGKFIDSEIKPQFICVDSLYEAYKLKKTGVKTDILIIGYTFPENFIFKPLDFRIPLLDLQTLEYLKNFQPGIKVHLKIDTGMNRLGIKEEQYEIFASELKKQNKVAVEGIYSHLADFENEEFSRKQMKKFDEAVDYFERRGFEFKWKHLFATGSAMKYKNSNLNLIRLGLGFYGLSPLTNNKEGNILKNLRPALKYITHLIDIKQVKSGEIVSYNKSFVAKKEMTIGILPIGYYDGINRKLSNKALFSIYGCYCQIVGSVCMNITAIDISSIKSPRTGMEVEIISNNTFAKNSVYEISAISQTIPYEFLCRLSETTRRVMVD